MKVGRKCIAIAQESKCLSFMCALIVIFESRTSTSSSTYTDHENEDTGQHRGAGMKCSSDCPTTSDRCTPTEHPVYSASRKSVHLLSTEKQYPKSKSNLLQFCFEVLWLKHSGEIFFPPRVIFFHSPGCPLPFAIIIQPLWSHLLVKMKEIITQATTVKPSFSIKTFHGS